jgi:hypothetical protein
MLCFLSSCLFRLPPACRSNFFHMPAIINGEPQQISMPSMFTGGLVPSGPCLVTTLTYPLPLQQILAPLMSSCGYKHAFCKEDGEKQGHLVAGTWHRKGLLTELPSQRSYRHALTCGSPVVGCVWGHLNLFSAACGPPKTGFERPAWSTASLRNSRISLSTGRHTCKPAAKPAIPGVILVHYGFLWPGRVPRDTAIPPPRVPNAEIPWWL